MAKDKILTTRQLIDYIKSLNITRDITQLHIHHTWKPVEADYKVASGYRVGDYDGTNADEIQQGIRDYHMSKGWVDIGHHLTLLPDGLWITGRDFNINPASIAGWNKGAFAIEMLGNFDKGNDVLDGAQLTSVAVFCKWFIQYFGLDYDDIKFHRDHPAAGKTCPGSGIDKAWFIAQVKKAPDVYPCKDWHSVANWAKDDVEWNIKNGILVGDPNGKFRPKDKVTRQELAKNNRNVIEYILKKYNKGG